MRLLFALIVSLPFVVSAQQTDTFVVKKKTVNWVTGYYCSDYMTDGRMCFYFDSTGTVEPFLNSRDLSHLASESKISGNQQFIMPFYQRGDTIRFTSFYGVSGMGFQKNTKGNLKTYIVGIRHENNIDMVISSEVDGAPATVKKITVYRVGNK